MTAHPPEREPGRAATAGHTALRVDAHQHFWRYDAVEYGWIDESMTSLRRDFLPADLLTELEASAVHATVAVQAIQTVGETRWLLQLSGANPFVAGVVGWMDLQADDVERQVEELAASEQLVGVRHVVQSEPDDRFLLRPSFCRGIGILAAAGLTYDILIYPRHLPVAAEFVARFPEQRFVLDHLAKPHIERGAIDKWSKDLGRLAQAPNVWCKLSGLVTEADWQQWQPEDIHPYLDVAFDCFGGERLMVGSDWPVCTLAGSYSRTMRVVADYIEGRPAPERDAVLGGNAVLFYGLQIGRPVDR